MSIDVTAADSGDGVSRRLHNKKNVKCILHSLLTIRSIIKNKNKTTTCTEYVCILAADKYRELLLFLFAVLVTPSFNVN